MMMIEYCLASERLEEGHVLNFSRFFRARRDVGRSGSTRGFEEANIEVEDVSYHSSQPWPFPASIMLGFYAKARSTEIRRNDEEVEDVSGLLGARLVNFQNSVSLYLEKIQSPVALIEDWLRNDY